MGYGSYSAAAHEVIAQARQALPPEAIFQRNDCDPAMNPRGVRHRESRDSDAHPSSLSVVFALDVSSSMGDIPHQLARETLPTFMQAILRIEPHPQVLFMAFGNAYADRSPLQVGQFESEAERMDRWLAATHIEGGGGGWGESYELAMYFAARHTALDCFEKRQKKGYFFMTGDEVPFVQVATEQVSGLLGEGLEAPIHISDITAELQTRYHVFFLIPDAERAARLECGAVWQGLLHERCIILEDTRDTAMVCALLLGIQEGRLQDEESRAALLQDGFGIQGEAAARLLRTVRPFALALARGAIAPPARLQRRTDEPDTQG